MITLRPYQEEALTAIMAALRQQRFVLLQAATGAGKTILFSEIIKRFMVQYPQMRIAILAHRKELITQAREKLLRVWPEGQGLIGIICAGLGGDQNPHAPVVIGSIQTAIRINQTKPINLLIVDEAHHIPHFSEKNKGQYQRIIERLELDFPNLRVLGVTATPFRLGHGYIYGSECKEGRENLFPNLTSSITIEELQAQGYLSPIRAKEAANLTQELDQIKMSAGDYNLGDLDNLMSKTVHIHQAVEAYQKYGENRKHVLIFCVSIRHAELVQDAFRQEGYPTSCVHSEMDSDTRDGALRSFSQGAIQILTNVGVLTEGWDAPIVDCIMLLRPTKSVGLFVQMIGRGTRLAEGKENLLVLDLVNNYTEHGNPSEPIVKWSKKTESAPAPMKSCPQCEEIVPARTMECPACGHQWPEPELVEDQKPVVMHEVSFAKKPTYEEIRVIEAKVLYHLSKQGNKMIRIHITGEPWNGGRPSLPVTFDHYIDIEGKASRYGQQKAITWWKNHAGTSPPKTVEQFIQREEAEVVIPSRLLVKEDGKWLKVVGW